ncbi:hypothetical protein [Phocaeicola plebeius]|uniref:hypothetical protein n=1 Tax=Phocaeicola plebeius TaxID=310297 RepID=UPI0026ECCA9C|nr:hypothetical protein [Phocaeicola plebeius]
MHLNTKLLPYGLALLAFCGICDAFHVHIPLIIIWILSFSTLFLFTYARKYFPQNGQLRIIDIYLIWNIFCILRGCFVAENYWDWKSLISTSIGLLMPTLCYVFTSPRYDIILLRNLIKSAIIIFPLLLLFSPHSDRPGRYLTFFYLFMIGISALRLKWKIITLIVVLFSCFYELDARSNIVRAIFAICIGLLYYLRNYIIKYLRYIQRFVSFVPILLLFLAATDRFNIFKINEYFGSSTITKIENGEIKEVDLSADTRTLLYKEVIESAIKNHHIIWGRTPARGYESQLFTLDSYENRNKKIRIGERHGTEVSILNIFLHTGLIGVILYFFIFYYGSYLSIFKSRNIYIKLIGLFIVFRWCYSWIEDFNQFDINYAILWMLISICYSQNFRKMTNIEFKNWLLNITK